MTDGLGPNSKRDGDGMVAASTAEMGDALKRKSTMITADQRVADLQKHEYLRCETNRSCGCGKSSQRAETKVGRVTAPGTRSKSSGYNAEREG